MYEPEPSLSYGYYDERRLFGKLLKYAGIFGVLVLCCWLGLNGSRNLERAALSQVKESKHVTVEQSQGQTTTITQENKQWLNNVIKEEK